MRHFEDQRDEELNAAGGFLNGRVTDELMAGFWPTADGRQAAESVDRWLKAGGR